MEAPHRSFTTVQVKGPDLTLGVPLLLSERAKVCGSMDRTIILGDRAETQKQAGCFDGTEASTRCSLWAGSDAGSPIFLLCLWFIVPDTPPTSEPVPLGFGRNGSVSVTRALGTTRESQDYRVSEGGSSNQGLRSPLYPSDAGAKRFPRPYLCGSYTRNPYPGFGVIGWGRNHRHIAI